MCLCVRVREDVYLLAAPRAAVLGASIYLSVSQRCLYMYMYMHVPYYTCTCMCHTTVTPSKSCIHGKSGHSIVNQGGSLRIEWRGEAMVTRREHMMLIWLAYMYKAVSICLQK